MLTFISPTTSTLFNHPSSHARWAPRRSHRRSSEDPGFPIHLADNVAKFKSPQSALKAGPQRCSAAYDAGNTSGADPASFIKPVVNYVPSHSPPPGSPSGIGSRELSNVDDTAGSQPKHFAGSINIADRRSPEPWSPASFVTKDNREEFHFELHRGPRPMPEHPHSVSTPPSSTSPRGNEVDLGPSDTLTEQPLSNPTGVVLTQAVQDIIDGALVSSDSLLSLEGLPSDAEFLVSPNEDDLRRQFKAIIDARDALTLRQYAVLADIGLCLESLDAKLRLYVKDEAALSTATENIDHVKEQAYELGLNIPFHDLEHYPLLSRSYGGSFKERYQHIYEEAEPLCGEYKRFQHIALQFMKDPAALIDHRLLHASVLQQ